MSHQKITIYTDGACSGNPGPGGFGVVMISGHHRKEISEGFKHTTNNRMELLSVIVALESIKNEGSEVVIYSDSKYVVDSIEKKWVFGWEKIAFKKKKNADLWKRFLQIFRKHKINFVWVKGHSTNKENNHCDELAVVASKKSHLKIDEGYLKNDSDESGLF